MACPRYLVFVCHNLRPPTDERGSCKARGAEAILERFKTLRRERKLAALYRATSSGCLGVCSAGPTVVVTRTSADGSSPFTTYYSGVRSEYVDEIVSGHLEGGTPVERLQTKEEWID